MYSSILLQNHPKRHEKRILILLLNSNEIFDGVNTIKQRVEKSIYNVPEVTDTSTCTIYEQRSFRVVQILFDGILTYSPSNTSHALIQAM